MNSFYLYRNPKRLHAVNALMTGKKLRRVPVWTGALLALGILCVGANDHLGPIRVSQAAEEGGGHDAGGGSSGGGHESGGGSSGGGHESGGGSSGGGHESGGGSSGGSHEAGGCSGGGCSGGGDKGRHGLGGGFGNRARKHGVDLDATSGHVSGEHGQQAGQREAQHGITGSHYFGAGWLGGSRHVPEGIGGGPQSGFGEPQYGGLGGGGRGFGYWGGRGETDGGGGGDDTTEPPVSPDDQLAGTVAGTGGPVIRTGDTGKELSCERFASEDLKGARRLSGKNLLRLKIAGRMIAPSYTSDAQGSAGFAERQLSYYQAEAARKNTDPMLLGTYLGLVAEKPVDLGTVKQLDQTLCVAIPPADSKEIVDIAEGQRKHLKAFIGSDAKK